MKFIQTNTTYFERDGVKCIVCRKGQRVPTSAPWCSLKCQEKSNQTTMENTKRIREKVRHENSQANRCVPKEVYK